MTHIGIYENYKVYKPLLLTYIRFFSLWTTIIYLEPEFPLGEIRGQLLLQEEQGEEQKEPNN